MCLCLVSRVEIALDSLWALQAKTWSVCCGVGLLLYSWSYSCCAALSVRFLCCPAPLSHCFFFKYNSAFYFAAKAHRRSD